MNQPIIRKAEFFDLEQIQKLSQELIKFEENIVKSEYLTSLNWALSNKGFENYKSNIEKETNYIFVACDNENIVGYMTCWINKKHDWDKYDTIEIGNLYVKDEYRKNGIGSKFMEIAKDICKENGIKYLELKVLNDNENALKFYQKHGMINYIITQHVKIQ